MYRFLLTPRWLATTLLAVLAVPFCVFMGTWQLSRFDARVASHRTAEQASKPGAQAPVPLHQVLPTPGAQVTRATAGRTVTATGRYDAARQLLVPGRVLDGKRGFYVLTPLRTQGGAALAVVRGWLPGDASTARGVPDAPGGQVTVTGTLQPSEAVGDDGVTSSGGLPSGQLGMISAASLVNLVPYPVYDGWVTVNTAAPPLRAVPPVTPRNSGLDMKAFQNLGYTGEWFVFAGFVIFMWVRLVRREAETERDVALGLIPAPGAPAGPVSAGDAPRTPAPDEAA